LILPKEDDGYQTDFAIPCSCMAEDGNQPGAEVPVVVLNLGFREEACNKI